MEMSTSATKRPLATRRQPPIAFAFGLFSGLLAILCMRALGTPDLDPVAYEIGVVSAAGAGIVTALGVGRLRPYPRYRRHSILLVIAAGALVGMTIQWLLLVRSAGHTVGLSSGLSTGEPFGWVAVGAPIGAVPALVAAALLASVERLFSNRAHDARERLFFPFATASALLGAVAVGTVGGREKILVSGVIALAAIALCEIMLADVRRLFWLRRIFEGNDDALEIVPLEAEQEASGLALVVGGVVPLSVIMQRGQEGYRVAARSPLAATGMTLADAIVPLRRRLLLVSFVLLVTLARVGVLLVS